MMEIVIKSVWVSLILVFVMSLNYGGITSFSAWQNEIKDIYRLTQTQGGSELV